MPLKHHLPAQHSDASLELYAEVKVVLRFSNTVSLNLFPTLDPLAKVLYYQFSSNPRSRKPGAQLQGKFLFRALACCLWLRMTTGHHSTSPVSTRKP
jgi:hypothetical protein